MVYWLLDTSVHTKIPASLSLVPSTDVFWLFNFQKSPFSKVSPDSGTFSNFMVEISNMRRPLFRAFTLIPF